MARRPEAVTRRARLRWVVAALAGVLAVGFGYWFFYGRHYAGTNDAYVSGNIVPVQAQTRGTATAVFVRRTQRVRKGEVLVRLQGSRARLSLDKAEAVLGTTVRRVRALFAQVAALKLHLRSLELARAEKEHDLTRYRNALASGAVSAIRMANTSDEIRTLSAQIAASAAQLKGTEAIVQGATIATNPLVRTAAVRLEAADLAFQRRDIRAPVSGFVAGRSVYPGSQVVPGQTLFTIVPLTDLWVVANIKETRMGSVRPGQRVTLTSDYYGGGVVYHGVVLGLLPGAGSAFSILPPDNATGNYIHIVERVPVRISLAGQDLVAHPLRPGLSMDVHVHLAHSGRSLWAPLTQTPLKDYQTAIYRGELQRAQRLVAGILSPGQDIKP